MIKLPVTPVSKPRMTRSDRWKERPVVMNYWAFKDELRLRAKEAGFALGEAFRVVFCLPMPASWSEKRKRQMEGQPHKQTPDLDNLEKSLGDCLSSEGDAYIWFKVSRKVWAREGCILIENIEENDQ